VVGLALAFGCAPPEPSPQVPTSPGPVASGPVCPSPAPTTAPPPTGPHQGGAYETLPEKLQTLLDTANAAVQSPGMAMGVKIGNGSNAFNWVGAAGVRNLSTGDPMQPADQYRIGSVTKNFIGTCVLQLIGEKKIATTDTLQKWLPNVFKTIDGTKITVQNLLQHTSGIPDYTHDEATFMKVYQTPPGYTFNAPTELLKVADRMQAEAIARKDTLPIGMFSYSSTNYILLAMIATLADGMTSTNPDGSVNYNWEGMVRKRIVEPLKLVETTMPKTGVQTIPDPNQHAYVNWQNFLGYNDAQCAAIKPPCQDVETDFTKQDTSGAWSAGAIISTAANLVRYMDGEMHGPLLNDDLRHIQQQFITAGDPNRPTLYVGLSIFQDSPYQFVGHRGAISGFNSTMQYQKDKDIIIVVLSNRSALSGRGVEWVPEAVFKMIYPDYPLPQSAPVPVEKRVPRSKRWQQLRNYSPMREY
jgi:D-alanyl-D-alanine carboxypeptidase